MGLSPDTIDPRIFDALLPPPDLTVSEWAEGFRVLGQRFSARPGLWRNIYTPYLIEPMDCFGRLGLQRVVLMTSSQVGKSEIGINAIMRTMDLDPGPMMIVLPREEDARKWSKGRLRDAIEKVPNLARKVPKPNSRKDGSATALDIQFDSGSLHLVGSNSAAGLASTPIRVLYLDEIDRYPESAGGTKGEGDPVELAETRTQTFSDRAILYTSTPGLKGVSRIESLYHEGDCRQWTCDCLSCGHSWVWGFQDIKFTDADPKTSRLLCPGCGELHGQKALRKMSQQGVWIPSRKAADSSTASFSIWSIHSPWVSMEDIVRRFLRAKDKPEQLQAFVNTVLGESWEQPGDSLDFDEIKGRSGTYGPDSVPLEVVVVTGAIDIQANRLELYVAGWHESEGHFGLLHQVFKGDPGQASTWKPLAELVANRRFTTTDGRSFRIAALAVDQGYRPDDATMGMRMIFQQSRKACQVYGIRGSDNPSSAIIGGRIGEATAKKIKQGQSSGRNPRVATGYWLGVNAIKDLLAARVNFDGRSGGWQWGEDFGDKWFDQLTSERRVLRRIRNRIKNIWELRPGKNRNEALDLCVYSYGALRLLKPKWKLLTKSRPGLEDNRKSAAGAAGTPKKKSVPARAPRRPRGKTLRLVT